MLVQFLLFPQCFQKASFPDPPKGVILWEWVTMSDRTICQPGPETSLLTEYAQNQQNLVMHQEVMQSDNSLERVKTDTSPQNKYRRRLAYFDPKVDNVRLLVDC